MQQGIRSELETFVVDTFLFGDAGALPSGDGSLIGGGVIDSTGVLEVIDFLETRYGLVVADDETVPANLDTLDALVAFVGRKLAAGTPLAG